MAPVKSKAIELSTDIGTAPVKVSSEKIFGEQRRVDKNGKPIRDFVSAGEKIHNEITYRGVDWLLNSACGVAFAYITHRTDVGRKYWAEPIEKGFTKVLSPVLKGDMLKKGAGYGGMFMSIMFGGTVTIPPLMALENPKNKVPFVKKLDTWIYGKDKVENDPKFAKAYDEIKHQPKKDFWTGMKTRGIALAPLLAFTLYEPSHLWVKKNFYDHISRGTKFVGNKLGLQKGAYWAERSVAELPHKLSAEAFERLETMPKAEFMKKAHFENVKERATFENLTDVEFSKKASDIKAGTPDNHTFLHDTIAFDFGLTILYSFLHEAAYKLFARKKDGKKHERAARQGGGDLIVSPSGADEVAPTKTPAALSETPSAQVSNVAAREVLKPAEQQQLV